MGRWVFHCHIFFHAVFGMISEFVVSAADGNERPYVNVNPANTYVNANAGDVLSVPGTYFDTDGDAVTLTASIGTVTDNGGGNWTWDYTTTGIEGTQLVYITATDANGHKDQALFQLSVQGPPIVTVDDASGNEGSAIAIHGTVVDPNGDPVTHNWTVTPGLGVDPGGSCVVAAPAALDTTVTCTDDGTFTLTLTASDGINPPVSQNGTLTVANVAPTISIASPPSGSVYIIGATVGVTANVVDPGSNDVLTCAFNWDGGGPNSVSVAGGGICAQSNMFNAAGVYTTTVVVSDDDGGVSLPATVVIVVYNPASKVTGGGTMPSPAGALVANPLISGPAQFNLNPQYLQQDTIPSGKATFTFKNAGLDFDSTILNIVFLALRAPWQAIACAAVLAGIGIELFSVFWDLSLQGHVPNELLSRVSAWDAIGSFVLMPAGYAVVGPISELVGLTPTLWGCAVIATVAILAQLLPRDVRELPHPVPRTA